MTALALESRPPAPARDEPATGTFHHFTVDVEEYFHVSAFEPYVSAAAWPRMESRVVSSMTRLLAMLEASGSRGTFFVLGWLAERHPELVRRIAGGGHEVASHGWDHRRVTHQTREEFRLSVRRTRETLEEMAGQPVLGFRAPSFSITRGEEWALDVLLEEGYRYDSSLFPVRRAGYGYAGGKRDPHWIARPGGRIAEVPPATLAIGALRLPAGGGAYFRLLPRSLVRAALRSAERRGAPGTFYIHPWEIDAEQPRMAVPWLTRVRHYGGLERTTSRLEALLARFAFRPILETLELT